MHELAPRYDHREVESPWYARWEKSGAFHAEDASDRRPFCIVIPPPNVTGMLHMGHALTLTIEDVMVRWHRMLGDNTLWMPGTDHAGIATQMVVERDLRKREGKSRHDLGREEFVRRIWAWKEQYGNRISEQARVLGASLDWARERFTMDEQLSRAVREVFVRLYEEGLIYRAQRLINWCPRCQTALSDLEVDYEDGYKGHLWHIAYPVTGEPGRELVVATTRPETMLGDTAVAVHPDDARYADLVGKTVTLPLVNREIPIIADGILVDMTFGSGVVKVTPGHDFNDFETGLRHGLPMISILDARARTTEEAGPYAGLDRAEARERVLLDLDARGLLRKVEDHVHAIGRCQRCETVLEPMLSTQWFVKTKPLAAPAIAAVEDGRTRIVPESWAKTYFHWMYNIQDWCVSRQLWWGHQIPAWYCANEHVVVSREAPRSCPTCGSTALARDPDVLDTWFSSALWPFSTLGWPDDTPALRTFYPTSVMETGHDILFFWVARMMMMGMKFMGEVPFRTVYLHGMVLDKHGSKMSKVKGNVVDPLDITGEVGADSLRFYLAIMSGQGRAIKFDMERVIGYRNFINKVWNAARFALRYLDGLRPEPFDASTLSLSLADRWMLSRLNRTVADVTAALESFQFEEAAGTLYRFFWHELCDWYIELAKAPLNGDDGPGKEAARRVLAHALDISLRLLHPFMPFVTEEIWQRLPVPRPSRGKCPTAETIVFAAWPEADRSRYDDDAERRMTLIQEVVTKIRTIRSEMTIPPTTAISVHICTETVDFATRVTFEYDQPPFGMPLSRDYLRAEGESVLMESERYIRELVRAGELVIGPNVQRPKASAMAVVGGFAIWVPLGGLIDLDVQKKRISKEIERLSGLIVNARKKLDNPNFRDRAPDDIKAAEQTKIEINEAALDRFRHTLAALSE